MELAAEKNQAAEKTGPDQVGQNCNKKVWGIMQNKWTIFSLHVSKGFFH